MILYWPQCTQLGLCHFHYMLLFILHNLAPFAVKNLAGGIYLINLEGSTNSKSVKLVVSR